MNALQETTRIQEAGGEEACFRLYRELADLPVVARFTIEGEPSVKGRPRFTRNGNVYTPSKTRTAQDRIALLFKDSAPDYVPGNVFTYGVMALFFCGMRQRRDTDNMLKLILDGLNGVAWEDDSQVMEVSGRKTLVSPPDARTEVVVYEIGKVQSFLSECVNCGAEFITYHSWQPPKNGKRFCTPDCLRDYRRKKNTRACLQCGTLFYDRPHSKYCSMECGKVNQGWKTGRPRKPAQATENIPGAEDDLE